MVASDPNTSGSARRALDRYAAELGGAAEPDMVLHSGDPATFDAGCRGAVFIEIDDDDAAAKVRWRQAFWRALVARQS